MSVFRHISELRKSGSLRSSKKSNEPTEHQLIFSSITHIPTHGLPSINLSKREQETIENVYNKIKLKYNIFPISSLRKLYSECGLGTLQWVNVAASIIESSLGWTSIINDIALQIENCLKKLESYRDEQSHNPVDKQIAAILENASECGVPVLRHVHNLLHSPDVDEDQMDDERPLPLNEEQIQQALVLLVCQAEGSTFSTTAHLLNEQLQEKLEKQRIEEERRRKEERLKSAMANNNKSGKDGNQKSSTFRKKVGLPITAAASFYVSHTQSSSSKDVVTTPQTPSLENVVDKDIVLEGATTSNKDDDQNDNINNDTDDHQNDDETTPQPDKPLQQSTESNNKSKIQSGLLSTRKSPTPHNNNSNKSSEEETEITVASLLENPDNTRVPFEDILLALSRLKHIATACECIITTVPIVLLDQIQKLAKNTDSVRPSSHQLATLLTNQVANIHARALFYFEQNEKEDPSGANANASYVEFSEQLGLLSAVMDLGTDPRGMPMMTMMMNPNNMNMNMNNNLQNEESFGAAIDQSFGGFGADTSFGSIESQPSSPGFFRVGSAIIQPKKDFKENQFYGGAFRQPHMASQEKLQLDQLRSIMSEGGYSNFANTHGFQQHHAQTAEMMSNNNSFSPGQLSQDFSIVAGFGGAGATNGEFSVRPSVPRQTFESPLRKGTISSIAQNFGLQMQAQTTGSSSSSAKPAIQQQQQQQQQQLSLQRKESTVANYSLSNTTNNNNSNNTTTAGASSNSNNNINDLITLESIAKEFFSHSQISSHKEMNYNSILAMMQHFQNNDPHLALMMNNNNANANNIGATSNSISSSFQDDAARKNSLRRKSMDVVTMLKVTKQFEDVAQEGAKQRQTQQERQGIISSSPQDASYDDENNSNHGDGHQEEDSEERNRTTASELLERTNLVCSPVVFHPGKLVPRSRRSKRLTNNNDSTNTSSISRSNSMALLNNNDNDTYNRRGTTSSGGLPPIAGKSRRGSIMGDPVEFQPSIMMNENDDEHNTNGRRSRGNNYKPQETSLSKSSKIVKQIANAPNLSSGAKLYYLRQRMAKLQREDEAAKASAASGTKTNKTKSKTVV